MQGSILDFIGKLFWLAIFATPLLSYWYVQSVFKGTKESLLFKILFGAFLSLLLAVVFFFISFGIALRGGLGPG